MKFLNIIFALIAMTVASAAQAYQFGVVVQQDGIGTFVQWNSDVAVTVKHVKLQRKGADGTVEDAPVVYADECIDLQFFENRGNAPKWGVAKIGDEVTAAGHVVKNDHIEKAFASGKVTTAMVPMCENQTSFLTHSGATSPGMSGGPVYRDADNVVVGITTAGVAKGTAKDANGDEVRSVFIPYQVIQQAWDWAVAHNQVKYASVK